MYATDQSFAERINKTAQMDTVDEEKFRYGLTAEASNDEKKSFVEFFLKTYRDKDGKKNQFLNTTMMVSNYSLFETLMGLLT